MNYLPIKLIVAISVLFISTSSVATEKNIMAADLAIAGALDNYSVEWGTNLHTPANKPKHTQSHLQFWHQTYDMSHDGSDSLQSGKISDNERAELYTMIEGPAEINFWWKVDSEPVNDVLGFTIYKVVDGKTKFYKQIDPISGEQDWTQQSLKVPEIGKFKLVWFYQKDGSQDSRKDSAWLDKVKISNQLNFKIYEKELDNKNWELSWATIPGRYYLLEASPKGKNGPWKPATKVHQAKGNKTSAMEFADNYKKRDYQVTLVEPPSLTSVPSVKISKIVGQNLNLLVKADGTQPIDFKWYKVLSDPKKIGSSNKLRISDLKRSDAGIYFVKATNIAGSERSPSFKLKIHQPAKVLKVKVPQGAYVPSVSEMTTVQFNEGAKTTISVEVTGDPPLSYQWQRFDPITKDWHDIANANAAHLQFKELQVADQGLYRVHISNLYGEDQSQPINFLVSSAVKILDLKPGESFNVFESDQVMLEVTTTGTPPFIYKWYKDNSLYSKDKLCHCDTSSEGKFVYRVMINNDVGFAAASEKVYLKVLPFTSYTLDALEMTFAPIRAGQFLMGSIIAPDEEPIHTVVINNAFWIGTTEVTKKQWNIVMKGNDVASNNANKPVTVSYLDALNFCKTLTKKEWDAGRTKYEYTLPTEAQWEYAAGTHDGPLKDYAWYSVGSRAAVAQKRPNNFGVYDMLGNVWEWVSDWYGKYSNLDSDYLNPKGPKQGEYRVLRGCSFYSSENACRKSNRYYDEPNRAKANYGFRIVRQRVNYISKYRLGASSK